MVRVPQHDQGQAKDQGQGQGQGRGRTFAPPLVRGVQASNDPRTQCEIEGLRMRRVVGVQVSRSGGDGGSETGAEGGTGNGSIGGDDKGPSERTSLASVGMVAKLRAKWERGEGARAATR